MFAPLFILWACVAHYGQECVLHAESSWAAHARLGDSEIRDLESTPLIIAHYRRVPPKQTDHVLTYLATLLLIHDLELNPGPNDQINDSTVYLCGVCQSDVNWDMKAVCCDQCLVWYHIECQNIHSLQYADMDRSSVMWDCQHCMMPNFSPDTITLSESNINLDDTSGTFTTSSTSGSPGQPQATSSPDPSSATSRGRKNKNAPTHLKVLNVNAQSILDKKARFQNLVDSTDPDIVIMTETWLKPDKADGEIGEAGRFACEYDIHRRDRPGKKTGGGVLIAVKKQYISSRQEDLEADSEKENAEMIWVKIPVEKCRTLYVSGFYRPKANDKESQKHLKTSLERLKNTRAHIWIEGDMNYPDIDWQDRTLKTGNKYTNLHNNFLDMIDEHHLSQVIKDPTRGENTLDLFLTNNETFVTNNQTLPGISDHSAILVESRIRADRVQQSPRRIPMWNKMKAEDTEAFCKHIKEGWESLSEETKAGSADSLWEWFTARLEEGIKQYVPHRNAGKKDHHPWISRVLKRLLKKEKKLHAKVKRYRSNTNISKLKDIQRKIQKRFRREYWAYVEDIICPTASAPDNQGRPDKKHSKRFWTFIKHNKQDSIGIASLQNPETGRLETKPTQKAQILNKQFQSVFSPRTPARLQTLCSDQTLPRYDTMQEFDISTNGLLKLLGTLKPHKAAGPDNVRPYMLRDLRDVIAPVLQAVFTRSYETGQLPKQWKEANVVPIYKKKDPKTGHLTTDRSP